MSTSAFQFTKGSPSVLTVFARATPKWVRIVLSIFTLAGFLAPIVVTAALVVNGDQFKSGLVISFAIFWIISLYLLRMILWNSFGKEILTVDLDKVSYYCDYKYFKGNVRELKTDLLQLEINKSPHNDQAGTLVFRNGTDKIEMVLPISVADLSAIEIEIRNSY